MNDLIMVRTHFVDDRVAEMARRFAAGGDYEVVIAIDESAGEIDTRGLPKLSVSLNSCLALGLNVAFPNPLWRCGDYLFYHALQLDRGYKRIWSIEYDITLNFADPLDFFRLLDRTAEEDYLTTFLEVAPADWHWGEAAKRRFPVVYKSGFAVVRLSATAIRRLLERRRREAAWLSELRLEPTTYWLNDEAFVSSAAPELGLGMADINKHREFYTPKTLMRGGVLHPDQVPAPDEKIYHAVRTGRAFLAAAYSYYDFDLREFFEGAEADLPEFSDAATHVLAGALRNLADDPAAVFGDSGVLAAAMPCFADPRAATALMRALARRRMRLCLEAVQLGRLGAGIARAPAGDNVALGRTAWQSSVSARSYSKDPRQDAEGGNNGDVNVEYGFHTAQEDQPWWAVDLGNVYAVREIRLYNRRINENRLNGFLVEWSDDGLSWRTAFSHDAQDRKRLLERPIVIAVDPPVNARYVRVRLPRRGALHLAEVEVYKV